MQSTVPLVQQSMGLVALTDPVFFGSDPDDCGSFGKQKKKVFFLFVEQDLYHLYLLF